MTHYRLGLIGSGIDNSLSPAFHQLAGEMLGLDVGYELIPRRPSLETGIGALLHQLGTDGYRGVNVTLPFKATASRTVPDRSPEVAATGVANTLLLGPGGSTHAFNTDVSGFKQAYGRRFGTRPPGPVGLIGAGGVGTAAAVALLDLGVSALRIYDIIPEHARRLARVLRDRDGGVHIDVVPSAVDAVDGVEGVVNGTPVGMTWSPGTPVDLEAVERQHWVFDAIYSPVETPLMVRAACVGLARITGFDLFFHQAIDAFRIFTGHTLPAPILSELETRLGILERERGL